jgi:hypothetical protein
MNLRARLILAFVVLSVLPLTAVTLYSYRSSLDALHKTAEAEASALAGTMALRMDAVTKNINRQLEQLCELPQPAAASGPAAPMPRVPADTKTAATMVTAVLGQSANMLDRLEFVVSTRSRPTVRTSRPAESAGTPRPKPARGRQPIARADCRRPGKAVRTLRRSATGRRDRRGS